MIGEDLGLHQYFSVHFWQSIQFLPVVSFTLICCSVSTAASYMLAPELHDCTMCSTPYDLVLGDSVTFMIRNPFSASLISFLYVILGRWFRLVFPGPAQMIHYVLSVHLYLYTWWIYFSTFYIWCIFYWAWVCSPQHELTLWFLSLVFGRLKSGEVLSCPCDVLSMCIIHFGHHVPLLTSYIRGHLL